MSRTPLSVPQVLALSPDEASSKAARGLVAPAKWPLLGAHDHAVWGECQGSGSKPYQTQADVSGAGPTFRCSCPSRKFPCKHGLALLLLQAQNPERFTAAEPAWVAEWLGARKERTEKKEAKAAAPVANVDVAARAKRESQRSARMAAGAQELALWLADTSHKGLAALAHNQASDRAAWATLAARMVDAQAPGLGQRLTQAVALVGQGADWPARLLARLGTLQLLADALLHPERLSPALQADVRLAAGWPLERDEVLAQGASVSDVWQVLAVVVVEREARLGERHVWLQGQNSRRYALLLDYSYAGKPFEQGWRVGSVQAGTLTFYPGVRPLRALAGTMTGTDTPFAPQPDDAKLQALAVHIATNPWAPGWPWCLAQACVQAPGAQVLHWSLWVAQHCLPLRLTDSDAWRLLAFAGGAPVTVFGEWDGEVLRPLSAWNASAAHWSASTLYDGVGA